MCFAAQRGALFRHVNFQKCSENSVLYILTWKCATRHNGVQVSISQLPKVPQAWVFCTFWLRNVLRATTAGNCSFLIWPVGSAPAALASLFFDPPSHKSLEKRSVSRLCYLFAYLHLPSLPLSLLWSSFFFSSLLTSAFSSVHIVGSLTSKFPSMAYVYLCARIVIILKTSEKRDRKQWKQSMKTMEKSTPWNIGSMKTMETLMKTCKHRWTW